MKGLHKEYQARPQSGLLHDCYRDRAWAANPAASRSMTTATQDAVRLSVQEQVNTEAFYAAEQVMGQAVTWFKTIRRHTPRAHQRPTPRPMRVSLTLSLVPPSGGLLIIAPTPRSSGTSGHRCYRRFCSPASQGSATVSQWLADEPIITVEALGQPWATGCLSNVTGTPEINAVSNDGSTPASYTSIQVSSCGLPSSTSDCKNGAYGNLNRQGNSCTEDLSADLSTAR